MNKKQKNFSNSMFLRLNKTIDWILANEDSQRLSASDFQPLIARLSRVFDTRGTKSGVDYVKSIRTAFVNYLSQERKESDIRLTKDGIPVALKELIPKIRMTRSPLLTRILLTILFSTRSLKGSPMEDTTSITSTAESSIELNTIGVFAKDFWRALGYNHFWSIPRRLRFKRFHFTTKAGPNGHALATCYRDLFSLPYQLVESIKIVGGSVISKIIDVSIESKDILKGISSVEPGEYRKIVSFPDKELKTRTIAICDYWSQTVLRQLHFWLFKALKKIPQDCTFDQGSFITNLKDEKIFYSVDLSSATDRFPIKLIALVLKGYLPEYYVNAWEDIMVGYPFRLQNPKETYVSYSVGNPMGAYSSWASFAFAHHYIIYYLCRVHNKDWKTLKYALLGDDIVLCDSIIGEEYIKLVRSLGVQISALKTHKSAHTYEFAKRWIHKGNEISPFPFSAIKESGKRYYTLTELLIVQRDRGWNWRFGIPAMVGDFTGRIKRMPSRFKKVMISNSTIFEQIMLIIRDPSRAADSINTICRTIGYPSLEYTQDEALKLLQRVAYKLFKESDPVLSQQRGEPLGDLATYWVMYLTGHEDPRAFELLECPMLHSYGSIEQKYLDSIKLLKSDDLVDSSQDWSLLLRNMGIPMSDAIFVEKRGSVSTRSMTSFSLELVKEIKLNNV